MPAKILIADDSAADRLTIKNMLSEYVTLTACDGEEAMLLLDQHPDIDILILGLSMPKIDGFEILRALKSDNRYKKLRTIILTVSDEPENEIKGLKMGAVDYIRKPVNFDSLRARIEVHLEYLKLQHLYEQKIHRQELTFDTFFYQAPIGIYISHARVSNGKIEVVFQDMNPKFEEIVGRAKKEIFKLGWEKFTHPDDLEEDLKNYEKLIAGEIDSYTMDKRYIRPDGSEVWVNIIVAKIDLQDGGRFSQICLVQDISERKEIEKSLKESERSKEVLLSHIPGMAYRCSYDKDWTMQYVSAGCYNLTGYAPESLLYNRDITFNEVISPEYREFLWNEWKRVIPRKAPFKYEYEITTAQGERKRVLEMGQAIYNEKDEVEALEGIILDISERKKMEDNLKFISEHDTWTGLYNRRYLENVLARDAETVSTEKRALIGINVSPIQALTLTYGFNYAQDVVKKVADALRMHCTDKRQLYSTFQNRFIFYVKGYEDKEDLIQFCRELVGTLESILSIERIGGGIGIIELNEDNKCDMGQLSKNLLVASEKAMNLYNADIGICFFDDELEAEVIREEEIKAELARISFDENYDGLYLKFQPILDLRTNKIRDFEALARINSEKLGLLMPGEFIPLAEKNKLIIPFGRKVIIKAFEFLNKLRENGYDSVRVSINISINQLVGEDFIKDLFNLIDEMKVNPENIVLEITESVFASDYFEINRILGMAQKAGIKVAIDDFGTGYSSISRELELNVDTIKIDKYFSDKLLDTNNTDPIIKEVITMIHKLGYDVIAEGVEYDEQKEFYVYNGCDKLQGYLISKPLDPEAAIEFMKNNCNN
ncbi:MAG: EAL domain-containing protein [Sedimentibacter sp.]|nr:EAL domain-containing protein [Sedimentibacter sp.]